MKNIKGILNNLTNFLKKLSFSTIFIIIFSISMPFSEESKDNNNNGKAQFVEKILVTARLPEEEESLEKIPANITIITSSEIEHSGAANIQELISEKAGIIFFDDIGNGIETTIDIRGFNEGTAIAVLLDGVRINEPDDNRVNLEQIPLSSIERIEIYRGSSSSIFGAGAISGTVNIVTKNLPDNSFLQLNTSYGSHDTDKEGIIGGFKIQNNAIFFDLNREASDGFRENGAYDLSNIFIKAGGSYGKIDDLSLTFLHNEGSLGAPGALTLDEFSIDNHQAPYNKVDGSNKKLSQYTLNIYKNFKKLGSLSTNLSYRENSIDTLTTGRSLSGFETDSDISSLGLVSQYNFNAFAGQKEISIGTGLEAQLSNFSSEGFLTDKNGVRISPAPFSSRETDVSKAAIFAQASMDISNMISLLGGARFDLEKFDYADLLQFNFNGSKKFSEASFKGGLNINPKESIAFYLLYSEAFLPPTVYDLFAFPQFGSNLDLKPTQSKNYEIGLRKKWSNFARIHASLFRIDVRKEIVFVITDPITYSGRNENVGKSRRNGLEIFSEINIFKSLSGFLNYAYTDAKLRSLDSKGKRVPLVPENKLSAGLVLKAGKEDELLMQLTGIYAGKQYLTNDEENSVQPLDSYTLLNARISKRWKRLNFIIEAKNILDEKYFTRGIALSSNFYTPAPARRIFGGIEYRMDF